MNNAKFVNTRARDKKQEEIIMKQPVNERETADTHVFFRETPRRTVIRGEGIYFYDSEGKRYIDGSGGPMVVNIGHGVKAIADAASRQMEQLAYIHSMTYLTEPIQKLATKITSLTPKSLNKVFFVSGGSEGTESAIKLACQYHLERGEPTKHKVISRWMSYHGNTLGALSASGFVYRRKKFQSLLLDFPHIPQLSLSDKNSVIASSSTGLLPFKASHN